MKKGFTLVEIAIVLMVIGLILGMVMKGRSLIDSAQVKADINKINKIEAAYVSYISKFNRRPGMNPSSADNGTAEAIYNDLLREGMVTDADFSTNVVGNGFWNFVGCTKGADAWTASAIATSSSICLVVSIASPKNTKDKTATIPANANNPKFACYIETMVDDKDLHAGQGMLAAAGDPITDFNNCDAESDAAADLGNYLFRIQ